MIQMVVTPVNCSGWEMRVWTESKSRPVVRESVDSFCAQDNRREYSIPDLFSKVSTAYRTYSVR